MSRRRAVVFAGWRKTGRLDREAVEMLVRGAMHQAGACALSRWLSAACEHAAAVPCPGGPAARYRDRRGRQLLTVLGPVSLERAY